jgi:hypothetical protein
MATELVRSVAIISGDEGCRAAKPWLFVSTAGTGSGYTSSFDAAREHDGSVLRVSGPVDTTAMRLTWFFLGACFALALLALGGLLGKSQRGTTVAQAVTPVAPAPAPADPPLPAAAPPAPVIACVAPSMIAPSAPRAAHARRVGAKPRGSKPMLATVLSDALAP